MGRQTSGVRFVTEVIPEITVANPDAELSDDAITALAALLLAAAEDGDGGDCA